MIKIIKCIICGDKRECKTLSSSAKYCLSCAKKVIDERKRVWREKNYDYKSPRCKYCNTLLRVERKKVCCGSNQCKKKYNSEWVAKNRKYRTQYEINRKKMKVITQKY